jgi:hypothetical protein
MSFSWAAAARFKLLDAGLVQVAWAGRDRREDEIMGEGGEVFVGIDVAKMRNAVAIADGGRGGEVRYVGEVEASDESMAPSVPVSASRLQVRATDWVNSRRLAIQYIGPQRFAPRRRRDPTGVMGPAASIADASGGSRRLCSNRHRKAGVSVKEQWLMAIGVDVHRPTGVHWQFIFTKTVILLDQSPARIRFEQGKLPANTSGAIPSISSLVPSAVMAMKSTTRLASVTADRRVIWMGRSHRLWGSNNVTRESAG